MKKYIGAVVGFAIILIAITYFSGTSDRGIVKQKLEDYKEIMNIDLYENYPDSPTKVVELFCDIERLMYSANFKDNKEDYIGNLIEKQCQLYDQELIDYNGGKDFIKLNATKDIEKFLEKGYKIIETKLHTSSAINADQDGNVLKYVNVIQYVNKGDNSYKMYCLRQDGRGKWKILTFTNIDQFTIS